MTQREFFNAIVNGVAYATKGKGDNKETIEIKVLNEDGTFTDEAIEFAKSRIKALDTANNNRKNGTSKTAKENAEVKARIFDGMEIGKTYTAKEIAELFELKSTQYATGLLMRMDGVEQSDYSPTGKARDRVKGYTRIA